MSKTLEILIKAKDLASGVFQKVAAAGKNAAQSFDPKKSLADAKATNTAAVLRMARGAGAAFALNYIATGVLNVTKAIEDQNAAVKRGEANWADWSNGVLQSLPLGVGAMAKVGGELNNLFTGLKDSIEQTTREISFGDLATKALQARADVSRKLKTGFEKQTFDLQLQLRLIGQEGFAAQVQQLANEAEKATADAKQKKHDSLAEYDKTSNDDLAKLRQESQKATTPAERADYSKRIAMATAEAATRRVGIEKAADDEIATQEKLNGLRRVDFLQQQYKASARVIQDYADRTAAILASANETTLQGQHDFLGAELAALQQQTAEKKAEIDKQLKEQLKVVSPALAQQLEDEATAQKAALDAAEAAKRKTVEANAVEETRLALLREMAGYGNAAAKVEADKVEHLRQQLEITKKLQAILADPNATPENKAKATANLAGVEQANRARVKADTKAMMSDALETQAKYGATARERNAAAKKLERQKIIDEAKERQAKLRELLNDPNATAEDKRTAKVAYAKWASLQGKRFDDEAFGGDRHGKPLASFENTHFKTGLEQKATQAEDKAAKLLSVSTDAKKVLEDVRGYLSDMADSARNTTQVAIGADSVYGG